MKNIAIFGANGAIGTAFMSQLSAQEDVARIHSFSRTAQDSNTPKIKHHQISYTESQLAEAAAQGPFDLVIIALGMLHDTDTQPEKALRDLDAAKMARLYHINTILPTLIIKHLSKALLKTEQSCIATLSARVGSISDNKLGGWYSYRASKAALNMIIKTASIELARTHKNAVIVGLHPGTVDSNLSKPFQAHVPEGKLFTADHAVEKMLDTLHQLTPEDSGKCFDYACNTITP